MYQLKDRQKLRAASGLATGNEEVESLNESIGSHGRLNMTSIFRSAVALAMLVFATSASATMECYISVPADLNQPFKFDKTLWSGKFESNALHFLIARDLSVLTAISEAQSN